MLKKVIQLVRGNRAGKIALCGALTLSVALGSNWFTLGYDVYQNGQKKGTVSAMDFAESQAEEQSYLKIISKDELDAGAIEATGEADGEIGCVLYLNNEPVLAVEDEEILQELLKEYEAENGETDSAFLNKAASWKTEAIFGIPLCSKEEAKQVLSTVDEDGIPLLGVMSVTGETWEEAIPYETTYENTDTLTKGHSVVKTAGKNGVIRHSGMVVRANKEEISRIDLSQEKVSEPENAVVLVGTREPGRGEGTGTYVKPCNGTFSSGYGSRWGRSHTGVDLSAPTGTNITAADSGTVVSAGWNKGGYGNLVIIDHGNGIQTYYAHCSELLVKVGDVVSQGELIARVGSTGNSTGSHLHFEIRVNGNPMNPTNYLSF